MEKFQNKYLEIKNISKDIVNWVEDVAEENNCKIERKEWKSKYKILHKNKIEQAQIYKKYIILHKN